MCCPELMQLYRSEAAEKSKQELLKVRSPMLHRSHRRKVRSNEREREEGEDEEKGEKGEKEEEKKKRRIIRT
jgi:hypothetical protein